MMNTKTSKIGLGKNQAEQEAQDIGVKIDIVRRSIQKYKKMLDYPHFTEESQGHLCERIANEELNLQMLKNKYPEYFI